MYTGKTRYAALLLIALITMILSSAAAVRSEAQATIGAGPATALLGEENRIVDIVKRISPTVVAVTSYDNTGTRVL
jgi:hypothetical protein